MRRTGPHPDDIAGVFIGTAIGVVIIILIALVMR